ncbi:hypothetical protein BHE16_05895 [Neomicrococcus aestuarii]|uniref:Threonine/serine exporter-like N-terminal domain-containing protein n=1 Tax=Neomicrococcus aestuarii TaxID=556325 RepID=A0A1L2ZNB5_9MICC|nr:hypothetical protein BHE16_05895 [Neomicrococcus aestuarii]
MGSVRDGSEDAELRAVQEAALARAEARRKLGSTSRKDYDAAASVKRAPEVSAARASANARTAWKRMWSADQEPTQAFSIVDRLVGSPYANPQVRTLPQDVLAVNTIEFVLDLGEQMFRFGAGALEVETSMIAVMASFGLRNVDVDITYQSIHVNYAPPNGASLSLLRVVRSWTNNYAGLALVHQLVTDIVQAGVSQAEAVERLRDITRRPKPFPKWIVSAAGAIFAGLFVLYIGGSPLGALVAFVSSILVMEIGKLGSKWRIPEFFATAASAFAATGIAMVLWAFDALISPAIVVAGGIMLLLPSARIVSSVQDAINGFPVTAAGRAFSAMITYAAIVAGIVSALVIGSLGGIPNLDVAEVVSISYPWWLMLLIVGGASAATSAVEQSAVRLLLPTAAIAMLGFIAYTVSDWIGTGERLTPAIAAVVIGFAARLVAMRMSAPQLVIAVPAIVFLLPGLMIFRAMYVIAMSPSELVNGLAGMFNAMMIIMAIAAGVVLGDTLARPFTRGWSRNERRRIRRR